MPGGGALRASLADRHWSQAQSTGRIMRKAVARSHPGGMLAVSYLCRDAIGKSATGMCAVARDLHLVFSVLAVLAAVLFGIRYGAPAGRMRAFL